MTKTIESLSSPRASYQKQWLVSSNSDPTVHYKVSLKHDGAFECSCKGWTRHSPRKDCRHIKEVKILLENKMKLSLAQELQLFKNAKVSAEETASLNKYLEGIMERGISIGSTEALGKPGFAVDDNGKPFCTNHLIPIEMEAQWGSFRCVECGYTISESEYYDAIRQLKGASSNKKHRKKRV